MTGQFSFLKIPYLIRQSSDEFIVMRDHDDTSLKLLNRRGQSSERVTIQIVGGLIQDQEMRTMPHGRREDQLDLLPSGQAANGGMGSEFRLQSKVLKILLDTDNGERAGSGLSLFGQDLPIHFIDQLFESTLDEFIAGNPTVEFDGAETLPRDFVIKGLFLLAAVHELVQDSFLAVDHPHLVHQSALLFVGQLARDLFVLLLVFSGGVALAEVLIRRFIEMVLQVMQGVLTHIGHADVGVLDKTSLVRLHLAGQQLDQSTLARAIGTQDRDATAETTRARDIHELRLRCAGVGKGDFLQGQERLLLTGDPVQKGRLGEVETEGGGLQRVVALGLGLDLDELGQIAVVVAQLALLVMHDVGADGVQEGAVVRDDETGDMRDFLGQVVLEPRDVGDVQVVGGLIQEQDIRLHEHGPRQGELHPPATRQPPTRHLALLRVEPDQFERPDDFLLGGRDGLGLERWILEHEFHTGQLRQRWIHIGFQVDGANLGGGREAIDLFGVDGPHQRALADTVVAT
mmetsp:Transcript_16107/g.28990  ORF Transcript_16107/g.28990 Transcript_16107/m.28990 type:complete len:515 (-) Transcript_16107:1255-2799(-)